MTYRRLLNNLKHRSLTPSQERLFDYIVEHDQEAVFLNIQDLAEKVNVSVATVVRLARTLGFDGFPEFQQELRSLFRTKLSTVFRFQSAAQKQQNEDNIFVKVFLQDIENLNETMRQISVDDFNHFVEALNSAKRIVIVGLRSAHSLAVLMGVALGFLQREVWIVEPGIGDMWDRLYGLKKDDVMCGISFPRYTRETVDALRFAHSRGINTIAITDSLISPVAKYAKFVLPVRCKLDSFIESFTAAVSLINAIVKAAGVYRKDATMDSLSRLEELWKRQGVYYEK